MKLGVICGSVNPKSGRSYLRQMAKLAAIAQGVIVLCVVACPAFAGMRAGQYEISSRMPTGGGAEKTYTACLKVSDINDINTALDKGLNLGAVEAECTVWDHSMQAGSYVSDYTCKSGPGGKRHMEAVMTDNQLVITDTAPLKFDGETINFGYVVSFRRAGDCH